MKYTTKATTENKTMTVRTAQVAKQIASFLVPDLNEGQKLAIVDEGVLRYLTALLPKAPQHEIVDQFIQKLIKIQGEFNSLQLAVDTSREFVAFHESVNLLRTYFDPKIKIEVEEPFNVVREMTITEKALRINVLQEEINKLSKEISNYNKSQHQTPEPTFQSPDDRHEQAINDLGN